MACLVLIWMRRRVVCFAAVLPIGFWSTGLSYTHLIRVFQLRKMMRYIAALASGRDAEAYSFRGPSTRVFEVLLIFFLSLHWYGIVWWYAYRVSPVTPQTWVACAYGNGNGIVDAPPTEQYLYSLYKAAAIIIAMGYGNVRASVDQHPRARSSRQIRRGCTFCEGRWLQPLAWRCSSRLWASLAA